MLKRFHTSMILVIILLPLIWLNTTLFSVVVGGFLIVSSFELYRMFKTEYPLKPVDLIFYTVFNGVIYASFYLYITTQISGLFFVNGLLLSIGIGLALSVFSPHPIAYFTNALTLGIYFSIAFASISFIQRLGTTVLLYVLLITMLSDVFAYFVGIRFGRHKLAPKVSPKKTVEGLIGGLLGAISISTLYIFLIDVPFPFDPPLPLWSFVVIAFFVSLAGQLGDLLASKIKRDYAIKDFSQLFPGHGGVLDRFDSTLFASFILVVLFILLGSL